MATVIKELSSRLGEGIGAVAASWPSPYVLIGAGAGTLILASHALAAGPRAASQPGFTILDPPWASPLGLFLVGEHFRRAQGHAGIEIPSWASIPRVSLLPQRSLTLPSWYLATWSARISKCFPVGGIPM